MKATKFFLKDWEILLLWVLTVISVWPSAVAQTEEDVFPLNLRTTWFSWEYGENSETTITRTAVEQWGKPLVHTSRRQDIHDYVFRKSSRCFACSRFMIISWNVVERVDSTCMNVNLTKKDFDLLEQIGCEHIFKIKSRNAYYSNKFTKELPQRGVMMYREDPSPVNCRYSIHGSYTFAYQVQDSFTGECYSHKSRLHSCEIPGSQFFISNQKFHLEFRRCEGIKNSFEGSGEFMCLGEWREGTQHYFVAANMRESRKEERYKCFLKNREDPYFLGMSRSPSCKFLITPDNSPVRLRLQPLREVLQPTCNFPNNISGTWVSSGFGEPQVEINSTHIVESRWVGFQLRKDVSVCIQNKGKRFLLAKLNEFGCKTEFVCWELLPRHQNIIRFRKSQSLTRNHFDVCDYGNFKSAQRWKYDTLIREEPEPIECPFSGRFTFGQSGATPLESRTVSGITRSPLDTYECLERHTDMSICDVDRKNLIIDLDYCWTLNGDGRPIEVKRIADYHLSCVGYWKENLVSYMVTYDPSDSVSRFRCWVYQRISLTEIRLSQGLGSACGLRQFFTSSTAEEGAALALNLSFIERQHDQCPFYYDDGSNPWKEEHSTLKIFTFNISGRKLTNPVLVVGFAIGLSVVVLRTESWVP